MVGLGTIINVAAIVAGGMIGMLFGRFVNERLQDGLTKACGVSTIFIAVSGALEQMLALEDGVITASGSILIVICLALGTLSLQTTSTPTPQPQFPMSRQQSTLVLWLVFPFKLQVWPDFLPNLES